MTNKQQQALGLIERLNHYSNTLPGKDYKLNNSDTIYSLTGVYTRYEGLDNYSSLVYVTYKNNPSSPGYPVELDTFLSTYKEVESVDVEN